MCKSEIKENRFVKSGLVYEVLRQIAEKYKEYRRMDDKIKAIKKVFEELGYKNAHVEWVEDKDYAKGIVGIDTLSMPRDIFEALEWLVGKDFAIQSVYLLATTKPVEIFEENERMKELGLPYKAGWNDSPDGGYDDYINIMVKEVNGIKVYVYLVINNRPK